MKTGLLLVAVLSGCPAGEHEGSFAGARAAMVREQLAGRGVHDRRVLQAMGEVPRHEFVLPQWRSQAYADRPLPIGMGQTISQPYIVARMLQEMELQGHHRVLEVGSGSGYAAAVLGRLAKDVYGIELESELHARSLATLARIGIGNVHLRAGDGFAGWPEEAPFDAILLSCAAEQLPDPLWEQLRMGGLAVLPRGEAGSVQELVRIRKRPSGPVVDKLGPVLFVPLRRP